MLGPIGPVFLSGLEGVERRGVEVGEAIALNPRGKLAAELLASIVDTRRSTQSTARPDDDTIGLTNCLAEEV